jgi:hypothetical protein
MSVLAFRKRTEALQDVERHTRPVNVRYGRNADDWSITPEDFSREVEMTRKHELLTVLLKQRALDPATTSLYEIKKKIELGC